MDENYEETHSTEQENEGKEVSIEPQVNEEQPKNISRKRSSQQAHKNKEEKAVVSTTLLLDRPARERKSIDRFSSSAVKDKVQKFKLAKGSGTRLKDIPNVDFKFSKRKGSDEPVQLLHKLIFGKRIKPHQAKTNILQFSGYVWGANEEKEKAKIKEKLDKCVKESLLQLSDLLDLGIHKTGTKKEEIVHRVFEFLESPHITTERLVQEDEQSKEKKRTRTPTKGKGKNYGGTPQKRPKYEVGTSKKKNDEEEEENDDNDDIEEHGEEFELPMEKKSSKRDVPSQEKISRVRRQSIKKPAKYRVGYESEEEEPKQKYEKRNRWQNKESVKETKGKSPSKSLTKSAKQSSVYELKEEELEDEPQIKAVKSKVFNKASKKQGTKEIKPSIKHSSKVNKKGSGKLSISVLKSKKKFEEHPTEGLPKNKKRKEACTDNEATKLSPIPSDEELRAAICEFLIDADFSKVTFTDVVKQLGAKFGVDLSQDKAHVKLLIQEEISKMDEEEDANDENCIANDVGKVGKGEDIGKEVKEDVVKEVKELDGVGKEVKAVDDVRKECKEEDDAEQVKQDDDDDGKEAKQEDDDGKEAKQEDDLGKEVKQEDDLEKGAKQEDDLGKEAKQEDDLGKEAKQEGVGKEVNEEQQPNVGVTNGD